MKNIVIHAGYSWKPFSFVLENETRGIGGSQLAVIKTAEAFARLGHVVSVYGDFDFLKVGIERHQEQSFIWNKVLYKHMNDYDVDAFVEIVDVLIVSRYLEFLRFDACQKIKRVWLWCHDADFTSSPEKLLQLDEKNQFVIWGLSDWHCHRLRNQLHDNKIQICKIQNGIDANRFHLLNGEKGKARFMYSSAMYRGLNVLLEIFMEYQKLDANASLHIYTDLDSPLVKRYFEKEKEIVQKLLKQAQAKNCNVVMKGWVSQSDLAKAWSEADIWAYPTDFEETYCITALEAQASGALCFYNALGALPETIGDRGYVFNEKWNAKQKAQFIYNNLLTNEANEKREKAKEFALQQTWEKVASMFLQKL